MRNSYDEHYQQAGTAHFCQTFAVMIHLGNDALPVGQKLKAYEYAKNIKRAMDFWHSFFKTNDAIADWLVAEYTKQSFFLALADVKKSAESLVGCKHG
ncbi:MAG: hypothetical protein P8171_25105 [Candidatus Thiodiazotropha sp.]